MRFPYTKSQIEAAVAARKYLRDWEPLTFEKSGEESRRGEALLEREDGKDDRLRLVARAGSLAQPLTYKSSLLLEDQKIRGIDHHAVGRSYKYRVVIPKGWHEDVIDPNREPDEKGYHERIPLTDFDPSEFIDFVRKVCRKWSIDLPPTDDSLL